MNRWDGRYRAMVLIVFLHPSNMAPSMDLWRNRKVRYDKRTRLAEKSNLQVFIGGADF